MNITVSLRAAVIAAILAVSGGVGTLKGAEPESGKNVVKKMQGDWVIDSKRSAVSNSQHSGPIQGGKLSVKANGTFSLVINYSEDAKSEGSGKIEIAEDRIDVVYSTGTGEWDNDIAELSKDGKSLTFFEEFNKENWKLVFVRK